MNPSTAPDSSTSAGVRRGTQAPTPMAPGDEAHPGTLGTGERVCPRCGGNGTTASGICPECQGTGKVTGGIGGD